MGPDDDRGQSGGEARQHQGTRPALLAAGQEADFDMSRGGMALQGRVMSVDRIAATPASYQTAAATTPLYGQMRPEVIRAMAALREMPPFAREREIETGRYSNFSPQEKEVLRNVH